MTLKSYNRYREFLRQNAQSHYLQNVYITFPQSNLQLHNNNFAAVGKIFNTYIT